MPQVLTIVDIVLLLRLLNFVRNELMNNLDVLWRRGKIINEIFTKSPVWK